MSYSSVVTHGRALVRALLSSRKHRVIYRPHPRTGVVDETYKQVNAEIIAMIESANTQDPRTQHIVDTAPGFGWQLDVADACIADISAVTFDWLSTCKPLLVTKPKNTGADIDENGITAALPLLRAKRAPKVIAELARAVEPEYEAARDKLAYWRFGDTAPGTSMTRWPEAARAVIDERCAELAPEPALPGLTRSLANIPETARSA